ncbi:hypothetical protein ERJ75_000279500 [Trypanosoma vivax]|nr:hypothetical protein ERJ75_000279500 [Trypanosoma vivax]
MCRFFGVAWAKELNPNDTPRASPCEMQCGSRSHAPPATHTRGIHHARHQAFQFRHRESFQRRRLPDLPYCFLAQANGAGFVAERRAGKFTVPGEAEALAQLAAASPRILGYNTAPLSYIMPRPADSNIVDPSAYF